MPNDSVSPSAPERMQLPRVIPAGGSKWAHCFAPRAKVMVSGDVTIRAGAVVHPNGEVFEDGAALGQRDADVFPLAAGQGVSLGRFISNLAASITPEASQEFDYCGARLSPGQAEALQKLAAAAGYITLEAPTRFRNVISLPPGASALAAAPQWRALAARLRGPGMPGTQRLAILPVRATERFSLTNRASLMAWLRAKRFGMIEPEAAPFEATAASLAAASLVILADPEQAGLVSLCQPGAKILEIAPEGWLGARTGWFCQVFGLQWSPFFANPPSYPLLHALPFGARVPLSYEIPIRALAKTVDALG